MWLKCKICETAGQETKQKAWLWNKYSIKFNSLKGCQPEAEQEEHVVLEKQ